MLPRALRDDRSCVDNSVGRSLDGVREQLAENEPTSTAQLAACVSLLTAGEGRLPAFQVVQGAQAHVGIEQGPASDPTLDSDADIVYRRVMDWDVEPTAFSEFVTIAARGGRLPVEVVQVSNNGFVSADPRSDMYPIASPPQLVEDYGPYDQGASFDLSFPDIGYGESVTFVQYYGATSSEEEATVALQAVGADVWSLAQPDVEGGAETGAPNTFIWAYKEQVGTT